MKERKTKIAVVIVLFLVGMMFLSLRGCKAATTPNDPKIDYLDLVNEPKQLA